jgi:hypothetical protein
MKKLTPILLIIFLPITIYGNAGTALMWATIFHILIGNLIIGISEGLLLVKIFKTSKKRSIILLILANYTSAFIGLGLLNAFAYSVDITILNIRNWFLIFIVLAFLATLIIEFIFYVFAFKKGERNIKSIIKANLLINIISYTFLILYYIPSSSITIFTNTTVTTLDKLNISDNYEIYYIAKGGKSIIKTDLKNRKKIKIKKIKSNDIYDQLFTKINNEKLYDLYLYQASYPPYKKNKKKEELIINNFAYKEEVKAYLNHKREDEEWLTFGYSLSMTENSNWNYYSDRSWPTGIDVTNKSKNLAFNLAMNAPFISWQTQNMIQIENGLVIFVLGWDQICILDPINMKIALIARGRGIVLKKVIE